MTPEIRQPAAARQQARVGQHIADDDPLDRRDFERERRGNRGKADIDGAVEGTQ